MERQQSGLGNAVSFPNCRRNLLAVVHWYRWERQRNSYVERERGLQERWRRLQRLGFAGTGTHRIRPSSLARAESDAATRPLMQ
jgi:hypothetical protein